MCRETGGWGLSLAQAREKQGAGGSVEKQGAGEKQVAGVQRNRGLGAQSRRETGGWWLSLAQDSAAFAERESGEFSESSKH